MEQISFSFESGPGRGQPADPVYSPVIRERFIQRFKAHYPDQVFTLRFNRNSSTMISCKRRYGRLELSLHHMFSEAPEPILRALALYLRGSKLEARLLDQFIANNRCLIKKKPKPRRSFKSGRIYDLINIFKALNHTYFGGAVDVDIIWGKARKSKRKKSIRLGSYSFDERLIRIHPALDQPLVPAYVIVAVVHHEMLHHALGIQKKNGRHFVHTPAFRSQEKAYRFYALAQRWEHKHLRRLLST